MTRMMQTCGAGVTAVFIVALLLAAITLASPPPRASAQTACDATIDFMLALDGSESISPADFDLERSFASDLVEHFTISPTNAHAGIVQFAGEGQGRVEMGLSSDPNAIQWAISVMVQIVGATDIEEGSAMAQGELTAAGRPGVPQVMIILTDGQHNQPGDPIAEAEAARGLGTEIFALAVGPGPDIAELNAIASDPDSEHVFSVSAFDALVAILDPLVQFVCPPTPTASPPGETPPTPPGGEAPPLPPEAQPSESPVVGVVRLPEVGRGDPAEDEAQRVGWRTVEALGGLSAAFFLVVATYWVAMRRARR